MAAALRYQTNGQYREALDAYQSILAAGSATGPEREARYHLAETYLLDGQFAAAVAAWETFLVDYAEDSRLPAARLMAARAYEALDQCDLALPHYEGYLALTSTLADLAFEHIGDCSAARGELDAAIVAYLHAVDAAADRGTEVGLHEKIATGYLAQGLYDDALNEYDTILEIARIGEYRAKIQYLAGQALAEAGQLDDAYARYRQAMDEDAEAGFAYLSLVELIEAGLEVDEFRRGLIDYHAGDGYPEAYEAAIRAFDRYRAAEAAPRADEALYYQALSYRALEQTDAALDRFETLLRDYPQSQWLARTWWAKATTLAQIDEDDLAVKAYQDLAAFFPADDLAPQALWQAAKLREGAGAYSEAARLYRDLQASFPAFEDAAAALWRSGLCYYRLGASEDARAAWSDLADKYPTSTYRPKSLFWMGRLDGEPGVTGRETAWDRLVDSHPRSYYTLRVRQVRDGESLTSSRLVTQVIEPPDWDAGLAETEILDWLRGWTTVPTATRLVALPASLSGRADLQRGAALLSANLRREALAAYDGARAAAWQDPLALAQLAFYFRDQGLHGLASRCAYRLVGLWPDGYIQDTPLPLQRLAYPLAYADLLSGEALERDLDPLLLAALIRQESLFEPVAESYAGARGLGQVMPATGEGIARNLGMVDFVLDDLYRPAVSVEFGAYYLALQLERFDRQILVALAAYNGGPGNALRWLEAAGGDDLDLFVEVITADQSRHYLQTVYQQYLLYETLYR